jgi:hypothetical protein
MSNEQLPEYARELWPIPESSNAEPPILATAEDPLEEVIHDTHQGVKNLQALLKDAVEPEDGGQVETIIDLLEQLVNGQKQLQLSLGALHGKLDAALGRKSPRHVSLAD